MLAYDSYNDIPRHARAIDVGLLASGGDRMISLSEGAEPYLLTEWVEGTAYADDLRAVVARAAATDLDHARVAALASYLAELHAPVDRPRSAYARAIRDLLGHGEGIFGIVDGYPPEVPGAPHLRLQGIERACLEWRWRLKDRGERLARTHGDFHPFNVLFDERGEVVVLDTSRGSLGDPADDVAAMAINYVFFAVDHQDSWPRGLSPLWHGFFARYLALRRDDELYAVIAPFLAWRALVLASPRWYPRLPIAARDRLLTLAERALAAPRFDPSFADELFQ
jgi:Ser/Thr protein kinase RdoA (MazF antagonist)